VKILVLGGDGMLGHQLLRSLGDGHDVRVTLRQPLSAYREYGLFSAANAIPALDARDGARLAETIREFSPNAVVNCVGIVKQRREAKAAIPSIEINSLLPHRLLEICAGAGARLIHFSTDCVFSGRKGGYDEDDGPDPEDLYGRTKLLGEVSDAPGLTLRTSIIGLELSRKAGLIEWFLAQRGTIRGFKRAIYTGLTTAEMGRLIRRILEQWPDVHGVWHVASSPISKYDLLTDLAGKLQRTDVEVVADTEFVCDRSLNADRFFRATGYEPPSWDTLLTELATEIHARP
jgi:dTDP-4-dehydrorhamnose reductase